MIAKNYPKRIEQVIVLLQQETRSKLGRKVSIRVIAEAVGLTDGGLRNLKDGVTKKLTRQNATAFEQAFGVASHWLLTGEGRMIVDRARFERFVKRPPALETDLPLLPERRDELLLRRGIVLQQDQIGAVLSLTLAGWGWLLSWYESQGLPPRVHQKDLDAMAQWTEGGGYPRKMRAVRVSLPLYQNASAEYIWAWLDGTPPRAHLWVHSGTSPDFLALSGMAGSPVETEPGLEISLNLTDAERQALPCLSPQQEGVDPIRELLAVKDELLAEKTARLAELQDMITLLKKQQGVVGAIEATEVQEPQKKVNGR